MDLKIIIMGKNEMKIFLKLFLIALFGIFTIINAQTEYTYAERANAKLKAFVFEPSNPAEPTSAILIFHGGGWSMGDPTWAFPVAKRFAEKGITAIAVEYRLSDEEKVTPLDGMADAQDAVRWTRENADKLGINPNKVAVYGWSAGGHLAVGTAIFNDSDNSEEISCVPNAVVLVSPAVSLLGDRWPRHLLLGKEDIRNISPDEHVREGLPPTLILQGDLDTVTPLAGAERFQRKMEEKGNRCELIVYKDYGHLFTPSSKPDSGMPQPDEEIQEKAMNESLKFLKSLSF